MSSRKKVCESMDVTEAESIECVNDCTIDENPKPQLPVTRSQILDAVTVIRTVEDSKRVVKHLMECHQIVAIDIKGRDLGRRNRKISLIAVGTCNGQCLLFDIHSNYQLILKGRLKYMLQCKELIKVMHGCSLLRAALEQCYGVKVCSIFDTQIAHAVIEGRRTGENPRCVPLETPMFISYTYGRCVATPTAHALEQLYLENCNFWDVRPLPCKQREYAARGVFALVPEAYNSLNRRLQGPLRRTFRMMCQGKCIELPDCESVQGQGTSFMDECYQTCSNKRSLSADRPCRSRSTSNSTVISERNSSCVRCGSSPTLPPRKKGKKAAKFSVPPRRSTSVSSCGSKNKRFMVSKTTKTTCTCKPAGSCCSNEICNCKRVKSVTGRISLPRNKRCAANSTSSTYLTCKRKNSELICKKKRSSCASFSCASTSKPKSRVRVCPKKKACPRKRSSGILACPKKKACPRKRSSCIIACPKKKACPRKRSSCILACPKKKACPRKRSSCILACPKKKACPRKRSSCILVCPKKKACPRKRSSCILVCPKKKACPRKRSSCIRPCPKKKACPRKRSSCIRPCFKKKACPRKCSPGKKRCVKPKKKNKCAPVNRNLPCRQSSSCICKTLRRKDGCPMKYSSLVRRGWNTVKSMDLDEAMETDDDEDDEDDFEDEMMPPAAKRKR